MATLGEQSLEVYIKKTVRDLAELFPDDPAVKNEASMRTLIEYGIAMAESYEIRARRDVSLLIFLVHDMGQGFEKLPANQWIETLLLDKELDGQEKMDIIYRRLEVAAGTPKNSR